MYCARCSKRMSEGGGREEKGRLVNWWVHVAWLGDCGWVIVVGDCGWVIVVG